METLTKVDFEALKNAFQKIGFTLSSGGERTASGIRYFIRIQRCEKGTFYRHDKFNPISVESAVSVEDAAKMLSLLVENNFLLAGDFGRWHTFYKFDSEKRIFVAMPTFQD